MAAFVFAAPRALSICPVAQDAMFGISAAITAAACAFGVNWNACAPISNPMYSRIGTIAGSGKIAPRKPNRPRKHRIAMTMPVAIE